MVDDVRVEAAITVVFIVDVVSVEIASVVNVFVYACRPAVLTYGIYPVAIVLPTAFVWIVLNRVRNSFVDAIG